MNRELFDRFSVSLTLRWFAVLMLMAFASGAIAAAGGGGGGGMPWETGTTAFVDSIQGPWATAVALLGICVAYGMWMFGGDMNVVSRGSVVLILCISVLIGAAQFLPLVSGGALLPGEPSVITETTEDMATTPGQP